MAKAKKKVVTTTKKKKTLSPTVSRTESKGSVASASPMLFNRENFKWVFIGIALIALGMILMMGGGMPSPDVWDDSLIYSHRRITLAPILILSGLAVEVYAIFKK